MHGEINSTINVLPPFKYFCQTIGELPSSYLESMTYYETMVWLCNYLKETIIPTVNNTGNAVTELQGLYIELQDYVNTYFENLDVQEEINNKLDSMASDGSLQEIVKNYVDPIINPFFAEVNSRLSLQDNKINAIEGGSPLVASSTAGMTDTDRVYVNTSDGKWYYYNGTAWAIGGTYQSTGISENSINFGNIANSTFKLINSDYKELEGVGLGVTKGKGYIVSNDEIVSSNNNKRCRFSFTCKSGIIINFINPDGDYKYGVLSSPEGTSSPLTDRYGIANYTSDWDTLIVTSSNYNSYVSYKITMGFTDERDLTDEDVTELSNAIKIYQLKTEINGENISNNTIGINNIYDINYPDNNIPYTVCNYTIQGNELYKADSSRAIVFPIKTNTTYNIKVAGEYNRSRIALIHQTPDELYDNFRDGETNHIPFIANKTGINTVKTDDYLSGEITFTTTNVSYRYAVIYIYRIASGYDDFNSISIQISSTNSPLVLEPTNINYPMFNSNDMYYTKIPKNLTRDQYYYESEYTATQEMQGLCTDGTYLYYCCHGDTDNDTSCIGKIDLSTGDIVLKKNNTSYRHANGMCYYPETNSLYIASLEDFNTSYPDFYILDADTLEQTGTVNLENLNTYWENFAYCPLEGVSAIAYSSVLDRFVVLLQPVTRTAGEKQIYGLAIYTTNWNLDKLMKFEASDDHRFRGGLWCDEKYIYIVSTLQNPYRDSITIVDYHGNTIIHKIINETYTGIEGIVVDYTNNVMYTSNSNDRIYKFTIDAYENIKLKDVYENYSLN